MWKTPATPRSCSVAGRRPQTVADSSNWPVLGAMLRSFPQSEARPLLSVVACRQPTAFAQARLSGRSSGPASAWCGWTSGSWTTPAARFRTFGRTRCAIVEGDARAARAAVSAGRRRRRLLRRGGRTNDRRRCLDQPGRAAGPAVRPGLRSGSHSLRRRTAGARRRGRVPARARPAAGSRRDLRTARPGPAQPFTANMAAARQQLERRARRPRPAARTGRVTEMSSDEAYEILRGNELVLRAITTVQAGDTRRRRRRHRSHAAVRGGPGRAPTAAPRERADDRRRRPTPTRGGSFRRLRRSAPRVPRHRRAQDRRPVLGRASTATTSPRARGCRGRGRRNVLCRSRVRPQSARRCRSAAAKSTADEPVEMSNRLEPLGSLAAETGGELVKDASTRLAAAFADALARRRRATTCWASRRAAPTPTASTGACGCRSTRPGARVISRTGYAVGATPTPRRPPARDRRRARARRSPSRGCKLEYTTYVGPVADARASSGSRSVSWRSCRWPRRQAAASGGRGDAGRRRVRRARQPHRPRRRERQRRDRAARRRANASRPARRRGRWRSICPPATTSCGASSASRAASSAARTGGSRCARSAATRWRPRICCSSRRASACPSARAGTRRGCSPA